MAMAAMATTTTGPKPSLTGRDLIFQYRFFEFRIAAKSPCPASRSRAPHCAAPCQWQGSRAAGVGKLCTKSVSSISRPCRSATLPRPLRDGCRSRQRQGPLRGDGRPDRVREGQVLAYMAAGSPPSSTPRMEPMHRCPPGWWEAGFAHTWGRGLGVAATPPRAAPCRGPTHAHVPPAQPSLTCMPACPRACTRREETIRRNREAMAAIGLVDTVKEVNSLRRTWVARRGRLCMCHGVRGGRGDGAAWRVVGPVTEGGRGTLNDAVTQPPAVCAHNFGQGRPAQARAPHTTAPSPPYRPSPPDPMAPHSQPRTRRASGKGAAPNPRPPKPRAQRFIPEEDLRRSCRRVAGRRGTPGRHPQGRTQARDALLGLPRTVWPNMNR
jgi:hypothetical protein